MLRNETLCSICIKFCSMVGTPNVIAYENFGDDWLRGSGVAGVKSRPSSLASTLKLCRITVQVYDNNKHGQSNLT